MKTRETPETDKRIGIISNGSNVVDASWARQLEQERDEARAELQYTATKLASVWLPKDQEEADAVKAERDQLRRVCDEADYLLERCRERLSFEPRYSGLCFLIKDHRNNNYNSLPHVIAAKKGKAE